MASFINVLYSITMLSLFIFHLIISMLGLNMTYALLWFVLYVARQDVLIRKCETWFTDAWFTSAFALPELWGGLDLVVTGDAFIPRQLNDSETTEQAQKRDKKMMENGNGFSDGHEQDTESTTTSAMSSTFYDSSSAAPLYGSRASAIVLCNHRQFLDTTLLCVLARQSNMLGDLKFFVKGSLLYFPVYGLTGHLLNVGLSIKRTSQGAQKKISGVMSHLTNTKTGRHPFWLTTFLEGTRLTEKKLADAQAFAKERDLPVLEHIMQPRVKGFIQLVQGLRDHAYAINDVTFGLVEKDTHRNPNPGIYDLVTKCVWGSAGKRPHPSVHVYQQRFLMSDIPTDEQQLKQWVYNLYQKKDHLLKQFYEEGKFPGQQVPIPKVDVPKVLISFLVLTLLSIPWALLISVVVKSIFSYLIVPSK